MSAPPTPEAKQLFDTLFDAIDQRPTAHPGDLTPEQQRQFAAHLARVNAREACPICDRDSWRLAWSGEWLTRTCQCCGGIQFFDGPACGVVRVPAPLTFDMGSKIAVWVPSEQSDLGQRVDDLLLKFRASKPLL